MNKLELKRQLKEKFYNIYGKDNTLYCIQLGDFTFRVFYKDKDKKQHLERYSIYYSSDTEQVNKLFSGLSMYQFKYNPIECLYKNVKFW